MSARFQIMGPDKDGEKMVNLLNGTMILQKRDGRDITTYDADPPRAEIIAREMGAENSKPLTSPAVRNEVE